MKATKQTALTSYYSSRKVCAVNSIKGKGTEEVFDAKNRILHTPKTGVGTPVGVSSDYSYPLPQKRARLSISSASLEKTPTTPKEPRSKISNEQVLCSARKRLLLKDVEDHKLSSTTLEQQPSNKPTAKYDRGDASSTHDRVVGTEETLKSASSSAMKRLASSGQLKELHARLKKIEKARAHLSELKLKKSQSALESSAQPAYERFHHLSQPQAQGLPLPYSYKQLSEIFRCCDTVVSMLFNRKEVCTFAKLKPSVEEMSKKRFSKEKLGQIKAVFPDSYIFTQERLLQRGGTSSDYQLVVAPQFPIGAGTTDTMSPAFLLERRRRFHTLLLLQVKQHHQKFLSGLMPPVVVSAEAITRWHPKFPLDSVPAILPTMPPQSPLKKICSTAQDVLDRVKGKLNERVERALETLVQKQHALSVPACTLPKEEAPAECLKGISQDLLDRIRARETFKLVKDMTMRPEDEKERAQLGQLVEFVRITRGLFLSEQKAAIPQEKLVLKVKDSFSCVLAVHEVEELVQLASRVLPDWLKVLTIRRGVFVKIVKEKDLNELVARVTNKLGV